MKLAVLDSHGDVLLAWPTVAAAHADIADQFAATFAPRKWQRRKRANVARAMRTHLLALQEETRRL